MSQWFFFFLRGKILFIYYFNPHLRTCLLILERGGGRKTGKERNINVREKHQLVASCHYWGRTPQCRHVPDRLLNLQPFGLPDDAPTNCHTGQGPKIFIVKKKRQNIMKKNEMGFLTL